MPQDLPSTPRHAKRASGEGTEVRRREEEDKTREGKGKERKSKRTRKRKTGYGTRKRKKEKGKRKDEGLNGEKGCRQAVGLQIVHLIMESCNFDTQSSHVNSTVATPHAHSTSPPHPTPTSTATPRAG
jgi:hypothetical protein